MKAKLTEYVNKILFRQISREKENSPKDIQFVFGHTHKPFTQVSNYSNYPKPVQIVNTYGWVVDTVDKKKKTYWGAVILIDENLNIAPVQMYRRHTRQMRLRFVCSPIHRKMNSQLEFLN